MNFLTKLEVEGWLSANGLVANREGFVRYKSGQLHSFTVSIEDKPSRVIALADYLVPTWQDETFDGAVFWIRERWVGSDFSEGVGNSILTSIRVACGETSSPTERPGCLFDSTELSRMHSYFCLPLLFAWDAFLVPVGKGYFVFVSHDGVVEVVSETKEVLNVVRERVLSWQPKADEHRYSRLAHK